MINFPSIETEHLILGKTAIKDISNLAFYANNRKIADNILNIPHPYQEEDAISFINRQIEGYKAKTAYIFSIYLKEKKEFTGVIALHLDTLSNKAEMGYWLGEPFWNKGIISEAVKAVLNFGFTNLNLHKIYATHFTDNPASGKVLRKAGMIEEAWLKDHYLKNDQYKDVIQYRLTRQEYGIQ